VRAAVYTGSGGPEVIKIAEVPTPEPGAEQVLVRVQASGLNRADVLQRMGRYPAPKGAPASIPGLEYTGTVEELGPGVTSLKRGQRVFGLVSAGGHAEFITSHERLVVPVSDNLDVVQAASVPESFITAADALFVQAGLTPGERVLIHAAAGGVGTAAVQLAKAAGCAVFATTRTPGKLQRLAGLGAGFPIDASGQSFAGSVLEHTGGQGVHVCIDFIGSSYLDQNLAALATKGRLVLVGVLGGARAPIDFGVVLNKRLRIVGTVLRSRPIEEKIAATRLFAECVLPQLSKGLVLPVVDRVFPLDQLADAHRYMESNAPFGKVVISVRSEA